MIAQLIDELVGVLTRPREHFRSFHRGPAGLLLPLCFAAVMAFCFFVSAQIGMRFGSETVVLPGGLLGGLAVLVGQTVGTLVVGLVFLGIGRLLGSTASYPAAVRLAADVTVVGPLIALVGMLPLGQFLALAPSLYGVLLLGFGLVDVLQADWKPVVAILIALILIPVGCATVIMFGFSARDRDETRRLAEDERRYIAAMAQTRTAAPEPLAAPPPPASTQPAAPSPRSAPAVWTVKFESVPPFAKVEVLPSGPTLGNTPLSYDFPDAVTGVELRFSLNGAEVTRFIRKGEADQVTIDFIKDARSARRGPPGKPKRAR